MTNDYLNIYSLVLLFLLIFKSFPNERNSLQMNIFIYITMSQLSRSMVLHLVGILAEVGTSFKKG